MMQKRFSHNVEFLSHIPWKAARRGFSSPPCPSIHFKLSFPDAVSSCPHVQHRPPCASSQDAMDLSRCFNPTLVSMPWSSSRRETISKEKKKLTHGCYKPRELRYAQGPPHLELVVKLKWLAGSTWCDCQIYLCCRGKVGRESHLNWSPRELLIQFCACTVLACIGKRSIVV